MASIGRDPGGQRRILFVAPDGKRKTVRLGKATQRTAEGIKTKVEALVVAAITGSPLEDEVARWVAALDSRMADKLAGVGLIPRREVATLASFLASYIATRTDAKPNTHLKYESTRKALVAYFGADKGLRDITEGDAEEWRLHLAPGRSENTLRKHAAVAKLFFGAAVKRRLIASNPFAGLKASIQANASRFYFITRAEAQKVLDACPDGQWRLLFALSRFGGLRCPSEHLGLRWGDVDWEGGRITVHSPKTEHHAGGESRQIPIFPELRPFLADAFDQAEPGTEFVITRYRDRNGNLRTQFERIIRKAGLEPWPKLFQNLRSTRQTELSESFPSHVVCRWLGNSRPVADKHYLQVTDEHFTPHAAQNPAQQPSEPAGKRSHPETRNPGFAGVCDGVRYCTTLQVAEAGIEPARAIMPTGF